LATHKTLANGSAAAKKSRCVEAYCKHLVKSFDGRERRVRSGRIYRLSRVRSVQAHCCIPPRRKQNTGVRRGPQSGGVEHKSRHRRPRQCQQAWATFTRKQIR
jgi:hypothetical protein